MPKHISQTSTEWTNLSSTVVNLNITGAPSGVAWLTSSNWNPSGGMFAVTGTVSGTSGTFQQLTASAMSSMTGGFVNLYASGAAVGANASVGGYLDLVLQLYTDYEGDAITWHTVSYLALSPVSNNMSYQLRGKVLRIAGTIYWGGVGAATGGTEMFSIPVTGVNNITAGSSYTAFPVSYLSGGDYYTTHVKMSASTTGTTFQLATALPSASNVVMDWTVLRTYWV